MFIVAGTKGQTSTAGSGQFYCPHCQTYTNYLHQKVHQKATVFFVPVANLKLLGEYVECQNCDNTYNMEVLNYDPREEQRNFQSLYSQGIKKVMIMMMLADGEIQASEIAMMKAIYSKVTNEGLSDYEIQEEVENCKQYPGEMESLIEDLFPYLNENGRELIFKTAYYMAIADDKHRREEEVLIKKIGKILQLSSSHMKGIIAEIQEL